MNKWKDWKRLIGPFPSEARWALFYLAGLPFIVYAVLRHIFAPHMSLNEWFDTANGEFALEISGAIGLVAFVVHTIRRGY